MLWKREQSLTENGPAFVSAAAAQNGEKDKADDEKANKGQVPQVPPKGTPLPAKLR